LEREDSTLFRSAIIDLGTRHHLVTKFTSFVAVEQRTEAVQGEMKVVKVGQVGKDTAAKISDNLKIDQVRREVASNLDLMMAPPEPTRLMGSIQAGSALRRASHRRAEEKESKQLFDAEFLQAEPKDDDSDDWEGDAGKFDGFSYFAPAPGGAAPVAMAPPPPPAAFAQAELAVSNSNSEIQPAAAYSRSSAPIEAITGALSRASDFFSDLIGATGSASSGEAAASPPARSSSRKGFVLFQMLCL